MSLKKDHKTCEATTCLLLGPFTLSVHSPTYRVMIVTARHCVGRGGQLACHRNDRNYAKDLEVIYQLI